MTSLKYLMYIRYYDDAHDDESKISQVERGKREGESVFHRWFCKSCAL